MDILNVYWLTSNFEMSFRYSGNYHLYKVYLSKVESRNPLSQAPLQLVLRLWPQDEDELFVNSGSEKPDMKKELLHKIINIESNRETSSWWIKQWQGHPAHWGLGEGKVSIGTVQQLNLDIFPSFVASEIGFFAGTFVIHLIPFNKYLFYLN